MIREWNFGKLNFKIGILENYSRIEILENWNFEKLFENGILEN